MNKERARQILNYEHNGKIPFSFMGIDSTIGFFHLNGLTDVEYGNLKTIQRHRKPYFSLIDILLQIALGIPF